MNWNLRSKIFPFVFPLAKKIIDENGHRLQKIPGLRKLISYAYQALKPRGVVLTELQGLKMYLDMRDEGVATEILGYGFYEPYESALFKKVIKPSMTVVDIGAHIGYYSLLAAKIIGDRGRVYAFEPEPNNYHLLMNNIRINGFSNIIATRKAASDKTGKIKLYTDKRNLGAHSFSDKNLTLGSECLEVEAITLDEFFAGSKNVKVDFIKMDIQGAEGLVIEKATETIKNNKHLKILMEFWPRGLSNVGTDPLGLLGKLRRFNFSITVVLQGGIQRIDEPAKILRIAECATPPYVNLFLEKGASD